MKKTFISILLMITSCFIFTLPVEAQEIGSDYLVTVGAYTTNTDYHRDDDFSHNCEDFAHTIRFGGYILLLVKILIPLLIIGKACINLIPAITSGKSDDLKKMLTSLAYSCIAGVIIFFIPTVVDTLFGFVARYNDNYTKDAEICSTCIFDPTSDECKKYAD